MKISKIKLFKKHEGKYTKFEIFQFVALLYNLWSFFVISVMNYLNHIYDKGGYQNPDVVRSKAYEIWSSVIDWYLNGYTLILTYMICSAILVFAVYSYILQKIKKAKGYFARPGKLYLAFMSAISAFVILTMVNVIF